jgi:primase-polymerase (primpol)-like protein
VKDLVGGLRTHFKRARSQWQELEVRMEQNVYGRAIFLKFILNYYVDDIK